MRYRKLGESWSVEVLDQTEGPREPSDADQLWFVTAADLPTFDAAAEIQKDEAEADDSPWPTRIVRIVREVWEP